MVNKKEKRLGVLGGMGPEATVQFYKIFLQLTNATTDQEHLEAIIAILPHIPDRTAAILKKGEDPSAQILEGIKLLAGAGAEFATITCNTAHYFLPQIADKLPIPVINMVEYVAREVSSLGWKTAGLLATDGTVQTGLYDDFLNRHNIKVVTPDAADQAKVMELIYGEKGIKAGFISEEHRQKLLNLINNLFSRGAEVVILGCTELPLVLKKEDMTGKILDPYVVLAREAIRFAKE